MLPSGGTAAPQGPSSQWMLAEIADVYSWHNPPSMKECVTVPRNSLSCKKAGIKVVAYASYQRDVTKRKWTTSTNWWKYAEVNGGSVRSSTFYFRPIPRRIKAGLDDYSPLLSVGRRRFFSGLSTGHQHLIHTVSFSWDIVAASLDCLPSPWGHLW